MIRIVLAFFVLAGAAVGAEPDILTITYPIEGNRRAMGSAVAIGPNLTLSADHVIRDDVSSLGPVVAVDRKYDRCLIRGDNESWSYLRRTPLEAGETLYFEGGTIRVEDDGSFEVTSGRAVSGMSGGPIWDSRDRIVSVVSEGEGDGSGRLWGYTGLSEWVDEHRPAPRPDFEASRPNYPEFPDSSTITFFTRPNCPPCESFKTSALPALESKGWRVDTVQAPGMVNPTFEYRGQRWTGYTSSSAFYRRLREAML